MPTTSTIHMTYEPATRVAYIHLAARESERQTTRCRWALDGQVIFDLDAQGRILGIEILDTRSSLREETLAAAQTRDDDARVEALVEQTLPKAA
jgi:uncharacterized protein YuzE